jgi:hypothetical protein
LLFGDGAEGQHGPAASIGKEHVDAPCLCLHLFIKAVEICGLGRIRLDPCGIRTDRGYGGIQLGLTAAGDEDLGPFGGEAPSRREADAASSTRYDRDLAFKLANRVCNSLLVDAPEDAVRSASAK